MISNQLSTLNSGECFRLISMAEKLNRTLLIVGSITPLKGSFSKIPAEGPQGYVNWSLNFSDLDLALTCTISK